MNTMMISSAPQPVVCPKNLMTSPRVAAADAFVSAQASVLHAVMDGLSAADPATATVADIVRAVDVGAFSTALSAADEGAKAVAPEYQPLSQGVTQAGAAIVLLLDAAKADTSPAEMHFGPILDELGDQFEVLHQATWVIDPSRDPRSANV
jgi:hypothetical protein